MVGGAADVIFTDATVTALVLLDSRFPFFFSGWFRQVICVVLIGVRAINKRADL